VATTTIKTKTVTAPTIRQITMASSITTAAVTTITMSPSSPSTTSTASITKNLQKFFVSYLSRLLCHVLVQLLLK
jgi:hypothetical protein